jgi:6-phosphogluconolactonase
MPEISSYKMNVSCDKEKLFEALACRIKDIACKTVEEQGVFSMALSGGNTPKGLYTRLALYDDTEFPWERTYLFLGDERCVPNTSAQSNYGMISKSLLSSISIPSSNVFPTIEPDKDPQLSARRYEQAIRRFFSNTQVPVFSLVLLGLGDDGHTASLFPGAEALGEEEKLFVANRVEKLDAMRLTMTMPLLAQANKIFFLVAGEEKADILSRVLASSNENVESYPSRLLLNRIKRTDTVEWYLDEACFSRLV